MGASFEACLWSEDLEKKKLEGLRFKVGDRVECNTRDGWAAGTIVALGYKSPDGSFNPYQIRLDSDTLIFAPMDDDRIIVPPSEPTCAPEKIEFPKNDQRTRTSPRPYSGLPRATCMQLISSLFTLWLDIKPLWRKISSLMR